MSERWKPEDTYYFVDSIGMVGIHKWCDDSADNAYYESGNCFRTEAEAMAASKEVKALLLRLHEQATECRQLPKLTTEVFDLPDCPKWAKYAVVNEDGSVFVFSSKPFSRSGGWAVTFNDTEIQTEFMDIGKYNASDWQNSLIKRPVALPEWCSVGEWIYIPAIGEYMQIEKVEDDLLFNKEGYHIPYNCCTQARPRLYNAYEMESLVGKVLKHSTGAYLVAAFENRWNQVKIESVWREPSELAELWTHLDDSPCSKLEHLNEKGEWVE